MLTSCAIAPNFDSNEYRLIVDMRHIAESSEIVCSNRVAAFQTSTLLNQQAIYLKLYTEYLPRNTLTTEMVTELVNMTGEFEKAYTDGEPSKRYCERKLEIINQNVITMQQITGRKPVR